MNAVVHMLRATDAARIDAVLERHSGTIDFGRDAVFGLSESGDALAGLAHLALGRCDGAAELALTVVPQHRGRGYGYALLSIAGAHAGRLGCRRLHLNGLAENQVIIHLARKAGMTVVRQNAEVEAHLALPRLEAPRATARGFAPFFRLFQLETP